MRQIITPSRGLILPPRFDENAYERYRIERVPFRPPIKRRATSSIVGTPFHTYPIGTGTTANTSISASVNDVIVILAFTNVTQPTAATITGATATMARQCAVTSNNSGGNSAIFTGLVTGAGTITASVTATGATDLGWTCVVVRGLSSATAHKTGTAAPTGNAATYTTSFTTTVQCTLIVGLGDESGNNPFSSWLPSGSTQINLDTTHLDGSAYKLGQAANTYTCGINSNSTSGTNVTIVAVALPESGGGGGFTPIDRRSTGPRVGSRSYY